MEKYKQELPKEVEMQLYNYIERIKAIKWFQPAVDINRDAIDTQVSVVLKCFGIEAGVEYRHLKTPADWDAARDAARDAAWDAARGAARGAAWDAARGAAWDAARDAARGAARGAAWDAARGAAWDAAWGAADILALNLDDYKKKYPQGNFINLIPLYEAGLYPVGVIDGKFIVYVPPCNMDFPTEF